MTAQHPIDAAGRRRSPATMPGYHAGKAPNNKGRTFPADLPTVDEIITVMRQAGDGTHGLRARALIVVLWRAALRIQEALSLTETDLDLRRSSILVRAGKGGHRREVGIDSWALTTGMRPRLEVRKTLPVGPLFCVIDGPTSGTRAWSSSAVRSEFHHLAADAGVRRRFAPHQLRHGHAVELARKGVPLPILQRQLGHRNMATTSLYLSGIGVEEVIATVASRPAPMMSADAGLELSTAHRSGSAQRFRSGARSGGPPAGWLHSVSAQRQH